MRWLSAAMIMSSLLSCVGLGATPGEPDLGVIADAPEPYTPPSLTATVPVDPPTFARSASFDLSAHPEKHEIRVSLMLGAPVSMKRWSRCLDLTIEVDGERLEVPARYSGVAMEGGFYDAVTAELSIEHVRAMSYATEVRADVCGDAVYPRADHFDQLRDFVRRFEEMATHDGPSPPLPPPEFDPEHPEDVVEPPRNPLPA